MMTAHGDEEFLEIDNYLKNAQVSIITILFYYDWSFFIVFNKLLINRIHNS